MLVGKEWNVGFEKRNKFKAEYKKNKNTITQVKYACVIINNAYKEQL